MPTTRKKILCTWELGGDLGHVSRLAGLARELLQRGFEVTVALKDLSRCHGFFADMDINLMQAPVWLPRISMQRPIACLPDTLLLNGYLEPDPLHALVRGWRSLFALVQPDLLVCDYSPTAMLASHGSGIPRIQVGTGFSEPATGGPIVDWRPWPATDGLVARQEQRVLQTINTVLQRLGATPLQRLSDLFATDATFITTYPEFDLYPDRTGATTYCITRNDQAFGPAVTWPAGNGPRIFAYLKRQHPQLPLLLEALSRCHARVFAACPDGDAALLQRFTGPNFACSTQLVDLEAAVAEADLFVGHGNMGSVTQALRAGKPLVALPVHLEQLLTGRQLQQLKLGALVEKIDSADTLAAQLEQWANDPDLHHHAAEFARRHQALAAASVSVLLADACDAQVTR